VNSTAAGGEVDAISAGNFGPLVIKNSITIDGKGLGTVVETSATAVAVAIEATSTSQVVLRNLSINGAGTGGGAIKFSNGGTLMVEGCAISGFANISIDDEAFGSDMYNGSNLYVKSTTIVGSSMALQINGSYLAEVTLEHVSATGLNPSAIAIANCSNVADVLITDSVFTNTTGYSGAGAGLSVDKTCAQTSVIVERSTFFGFGYGINLFAGTVNLSDSTIYRTNYSAVARASSTLTLSNNNFYFNHYTPYCAQTTAQHTAFLSAGNNRETTDPGGSYESCSSTGPFRVQ
jgi:hypothetical protein